MLAYLPNVSSQFAHRLHGLEKLIPRARDLEDVDYAILPGQFGVAANGAVWVTDEGLKHRASYFIVQHLAPVITSGELVDNMHQAYERLSFPTVCFFQAHRKRRTSSNRW